MGVEILAEQNAEEIPTQEGGDAHKAPILREMGYVGMNK